MATSRSTVDTTESDDLLVRITEAVADSADIDTTSLPPLERAIDTEALVAIVDGDAVSELTFSYYDYSVTVDSTGQVRVSPDTP